MTREEAKAIADAVPTLDGAWDGELLLALVHVLAKVKRAAEAGLYSVEVSGYPDAKEDGLLKALRKLNYTVDFKKKNLLLLSWA